MHRKYSVSLDGRTGNDAQDIETMYAFCYTMWVACPHCDGRKSVG